MAPLAPVIQALWLAADCELRRVDGPVRWPSPIVCDFLEGSVSAVSKPICARQNILILQHFQ